MSLIDLAKAERLHHLARNEVRVDLVVGLDEMPVDIDCQSIVYRSPEYILIHWEENLGYTVVEPQTKESRND